MATDRFRAILHRLAKNHVLARLVVDEAHCISEWGHEFRKNYRRLDYFKDTFPSQPVMALTASATDQVQQDIMNQLHLSKDCFILKSSFHRPNLNYEVRFKQVDRNPFSDILELLQQMYTRREGRLKKDKIDERAQAICGIIYCSTRALCDDMAIHLQEHQIHAKAYHGGMSAKARTQVLADWTSTSAKPNQNTHNIVDIVCATISFGMGIDRPDVRFVIHYDMPKSLEGYYQESGRAGRDGAVSRCILCVWLLMRSIKNTPFWLRSKV